jgi:FtsH-binding integral membrane protein
MKSNTLWALIPAVMLAFATSRLPHGYYQLLRIVVCVASIAVIVSTSAKVQRLTVWGIIFALIALAFNPIVPVRFGRETWQYVDVVAACVFGAFAVLGLIKNKNSPRSESEHTASSETR